MPLDRGEGLERIGKNSLPFTNIKVNCRKGKAHH